jgi:DNA invertase Pin-like site-specific DNA recombinase
MADLIGYIRVSRIAGREGDSFISPDVQRERIEAHAKAHGHEVVSWETDLDQPGSRYMRPGFQRALEAVERGEANGVIVARLDRFARSVAGAAQAVARLEASGGVLVAVDLGLDTSTPAGKLMRNVLMALAEFELDRIRESWQSAREHAITRGIHISKVPPVGYRRGEDRRLEPDPVAGPVVREVLLRRARGHSWDSLCAYLDGALPRPNGGAWTRQTVTSMVARRTYLGEAHAGSTSNPDAHEPLVSRSEWEAAQQRPRSRRPRSTALLSRIIRCSACGYAMTRGEGGSRGYWNYRCRKRHSTGLCPSPARISVLKADGFVWRSVEQFVRDGAATLQSEENRTLAEDRYAEAITEVERAEQELAAWTSNELVSVLGEETFIAGYRQRDAALLQAKEAVSSCGSSIVEMPPPDFDFDALNAEERRTLIDILIERIEVDRGRGDGRLRILWRTLP